MIWMPYSKRRKGWSRIEKVSRILCIFCLFCVIICSNVKEKHYFRMSTPLCKNKGCWPECKRLHCNWSIDGTIILERKDGSKFMWITFENKRSYSADKCLVFWINRQLNMLIWLVSVLEKWNWWILAVVKFEFSAANRSCIFQEGSLHLRAHKSKLRKTKRQFLVRIDYRVNLQGSYREDCLYLSLWMA